MRARFAVDVSVSGMSCVRVSWVHVCVALFVRLCIKGWGTNRLA